MPSRETWARAAAASISAAAPSRTGSAICSSFSLRAAATMRSSCPSGNTRRLPRARACALQASTMSLTRYGLLERYIVIHVIKRCAAALFRRRLAAAGRLCRRGPGLAARHRVGAAGARAEHLHAISDDLGRITVVTFLVLPFARLQAALDINLGALLQVLAADFRQFGERGNAVPFRALLLLAAFVFPLVRGRDAEIAHRTSVWQKARFGIFAEIAN